MTHVLHSRVRHAVAAAMVLGLAAACQTTEPQAHRETDTPPVVVQTMRLTAQPLTDSVEVGGIVHARTTTLLAAKIMAPVQSIRATAGTRVRAGDVLVVLDATDLMAQVRAASAGASAAVDDASAASAAESEAEAALQLATSSHARVAQLHAQRSATPQELDTATAALAVATARRTAAQARSAAANRAVDRAKAAADAATATLSFATLTAPYDGTVAATLVEVGSMATPGLPLVRVDQAGETRLEVDVDASVATALTVGVPVPALLDTAATEGPLAVTGVVSEIARAADPATQTVHVKVTLPADAVALPGRFGRLRISRGRRHGLTLPREAMQQHGQVVTVFVVEEAHARLRMVDVRGNEVLAGVSDGDTVVLSPPSALRDGQAVSVSGRQP